jgi:hypothetical protein
MLQRWLELPPHRVLMRRQIVFIGLQRHLQ